MCRYGCGYFVLCFHMAECVCLDIVVSLFSVLSPPMVMWEDTSLFSLGI